MHSKHWLGTALAFYLATGCAGEATDESSALAARHHGEMESLERSAWASLATGTALPKTRYRWPTEVLSIGHTGASYQNYGGSPYFHHGLDIRADAGTDVVASAGGKVVNIENYGGSAAYWEVAILDPDGFLWQYHHVDHASIPREIHDAFRTGGSISAGTKIGEVFYWGVVTYGERYHHVHLNILGEGGRYKNPFDFLEPLDDRQAPAFTEVGLLKNGNRVNGTRVSGSYTVYAQVHDLILHDKFVVPPQSLSFSIDGGASVTVWDFAELPGGASNTQFVNNFFAPRLTCGDYGCRKLAIDLGFNKAGTRYFTTAPGNHTVEMVAKDYTGNETRQAFAWTVD